MKDSLVQIRVAGTGWWVGTGFFVGANCSIVTARHVVEEYDSENIARGLAAELPSGQVVTLRVDYEVISKDLVVLEPVRAIRCKQLNLHEGSLSLGQQLIMVGFPDYYYGDEATLTAIPIHVINVDVPEYLEADFLVLVPTHIGHSGSPMLNDEGEVVGMLVAALPYEFFDENNADFGYIPVAMGVEVAKHLR